MKRFNLFQSSSVLACASALALSCAAGAAFGAADPDSPGSMSKPAMKQAVKETMKLGVGDAAPGLEIENWVKGEPVTGFEKGRVYVVEFWATWCGPCIVSIPHLTEMQHKFKKDGVTMIGISSSDKDLQTVQSFVEKMGEKMDYTVAVDRKAAMGDAERAVALTSQSYMTASGQRGIPTAFVVDRDSKIAWIGHPMSYLESVVEDVVAGKFDAAKQQQMQAEGDELMQQLNVAARGGDWDTALAKLGEYRTMHRSHAERANDMELNILLSGKKDYAAAYTMANKFIDGPYSNKAESLNELAWRILTDPSIEERNNDVALRAATRANELTKGADASILDTLAKAYFEKGDVKKAIETQKMAVSKATGEEMTEQLQATLDEYKAAGATK